MPALKTPVHTLPRGETPAESAMLAEFQWLMAGDGHQIDLARLHQDRAYARGCLALARGSTTPALQAAAQALGPWLRANWPRP